MTKQRVEPTDGPRASLAAAIESARDAEAHCQALRASVTRIEDQLYAARGQLERAREQDEEANSAHVRAIVAGADSMVLQRPPRSAVAEVQKTIEACRAAKEMVAQELAEAEQSVGFKVMRVRSAIGAVIAAEKLDAMVADAARLRGELEAREAVLSFLHPQVPRQHKAKVERALVSSDVRGPHPAIDPWRAALEALSRDATTALPR